VKGSDSLRGMYQKGYTMREWITCLDGTHGEESYMLICERCGATQRPTTLPIAVNDFVGLMRTFRATHKGCKTKKAAPAE
jgi:hypothetical protein